MWMWMEEWESEWHSQTSWQIKETKHEREQEKIKQVSYKKKRDIYKDGQIEEHIEMISETNHKSFIE